MKYKHYIISQFNLRRWDTDKKNNKTRTDQWLKTRFHIFSQYCLPSIMQQTCKDFTWLCLFDKETQQEYRDIIYKYQKDFPIFQPLFFAKEDMEHWLETLSKHIFDDSDNYDFILTTNLDNDDALHKDFVKALHQDVEHHHSEGLYTFIYEMQYFPSKKLLMRMRYPHNHFLNYLTRRDKNMITIENLRHATARKMGISIIDNYSTEAYWMEIVHDCNVSNDLRITSRIRYKFHWHQFSLIPYGLNFSLTTKQFLKANLITYPRLFAITGIRKLKKKIFK